MVSMDRMWVYPIQDNEIGSVRMPTGKTNLNVTNATAGVALLGAGRAWFRTVLTLVSSLNSVSIGSKRFRARLT